MNTDKILKDLNFEGFSIIENFLTNEEIDISVNNIEKNIENQNSKVYSVRNENTGGDKRLFAFENKCIISYEFKHNSLINEIANKYCKDKLKSYFILAGKVSFKKNENTNSGGDWHKDSDEKQIKAMVYLNDVDVDNGPLLFITDSKLKEPKRRKNELTFESIIRFFKYRSFYPPRYSSSVINKYLTENNFSIKKITAKKGTLILFDSSYIHRGDNIKKGHRYSLTSYFHKDNIKTEKGIIEKYGQRFIR